MTKTTRSSADRRQIRAEPSSYDQPVDHRYDERKFSELLLYVADRLGADTAGGATKLNKVLYFADFTHIRRTGRPITGAEYQRLENGPAPRRLLPVRRMLVEAGDATLEEIDYLGYKQHRLVAERAPDLSVFDADELTTINDVLDDLASLSGREVSELSHEEAGWRLTNEGNTIPFEAAFIPRQQPLTSAAVAQASAVADRYGMSADS